LHIVDFMMQSYHGDMPEIFSYNLVRNRIKPKLIEIESVNEVLKKLNSSILSCQQNQIFTTVSIPQFQISNLVQGTLYCCKY